MYISEVLKYVKLEMAYDKGFPRQGQSVEHPVSLPEMFLVVGASVSRNNNAQASTGSS